MPASGGVSPGFHSLLKFAWLSNQSPLPVPDRPMNLFQPTADITDLFKYSEKNNRIWRAAAGGSLMNTNPDKWQVGRKFSGAAARGLSKFRQPPSTGVSRPRPYHNRRL